MRRKRCPGCHQKIPEDAISCQQCGLFFDVAPPSDSEFDYIAAMMSLILPGAGQIRKGFVGIGLLWLIGTGFAYLFTVLGLSMLTPPSPSWVARILGVLITVPGPAVHIACIREAGQLRDEGLGDDESG